MYKVIIKFLIFTLVFFSVSFTSSKVYSHDQRQRYRSLDAILELPKLNTVILGDSQAVRGLDPLEFDQAFNYASLGENIILSYYKLADLVQKRNDIKQVILTASLGYFAGDKSKHFSRLFLWKDMIDFIELSKVTQKPYAQFKKYFMAEFFAYKGMRKSYFKRYFAKMKYPTPYYRGFRPKPEGNYYDVSKRAKQYFGGKNKEDQVLWYYTRAFLKLAQEHNINVLLLRMPTSKRYYDKAIAELEEDKLPLQVKELQRSYTNLSFVDYINEYWGDEAEYMFDDLHLNKLGAKLISKKLKMTCNFNTSC